MRRQILIILTFTLACSTNPSDGAEDESSSTTNSSTNTDSGTGTGTDTETSTDTETGMDTGEMPCDPMQATLSPCNPPTTQAFIWNGQECNLIEGCECMGPDCAALFTFQPDFLGSDAPRHTAEHQCWSTYIDAGCMTDPCDCPPGEFCVAYYDGTCTGGNLMCTPMPAGCEDDPQNCDSGCPEQICEGPGNPCFASPCGGEWSNAIYCYGI
jgi:hypothetical protein